MTTWILTADTSIAGLIEIAKARGGDIALIALSPQAAAIAGADSVTALWSEGTPAEAFAPAAVAAVTPQPGDLILAPNRPAERAIAGAVAAALNAPVVTGVREASADSIDIGRFGGISLETVTSAGPIVAVVEGGGAAEIGTAAPDAAEAETYPARVSAENSAGTVASDLSSAKRIVAAGRGVGSEGDLQLIREFAAALGAEVACSRPLAEGLDWMPKETYIGVSGKTVKPDLYVAVGISGQLQHMVGAQDSRRIVAINTDAKAPIFAYADYGVVGDLYEVLPALTAALA